MSHTRGKILASLVLGSLTLPAAPRPVPAKQAAEPQSPAPIARMSPRALDRALRAQARQSLAKRIAYWSRLFRGTPYWVPPPGHPEPTGADLQRVDCETFVEQVLALSLSRRRADFVKRLHRLRFEGGVVRESHRHFTVVRGWLEKNRRAGYLEDITRSVGGSATRVVQRDLTPVGWSPVYLRRYMSLGVRAPKGRARITYIPWRRATRLVTRIPNGTIIHVVAAPHPRSPYLVTHVGLGISHSHWGTVFRHASQSPHRRRVEDRPLGPYLYYISHTRSGPERRTGIGIHLSRLKKSSGK